MVIKAKSIEIFAMAPKYVILGISLVITISIGTEIGVRDNNAVFAEALYSMRFEL